MKGSCESGDLANGMKNRQEQGISDSERHCQIPAGGIFLGN